MYRVPSSLQRSNKERTKLNLIPILDSVFIFIFFLLVSANFVNLKELSSDIPIISSEAPDKEPFILTVDISNNNLKLSQGLNDQEIGTYRFDSLDSFQEKLIELKEQYPEEKTIIFNPSDSIDYETIVEIMDITRVTEEKDELFSNIVFGNITNE